MTSAIPFASDRRLCLLIAAVLAIGIWLRVDASVRYRPGGADEFYYGVYVKFLDENGLGAYPDLVEQYLQGKRRSDDAVLPPTRIFYIAGATVVKQLTGCEERRALNIVSAGSSILLLGLALGCAWRMAGRRTALVTLALLAFAPTQLYMANYALIDVTVALWTAAALWALWEVLQAPENNRALLALGGSLAMLVLTKENAFFAVAGLAAIVALNRWLRFGTVTSRLVAASAAGLMVGVAILAVACGGLDRAYDVIYVFTTNAVKLPYAILTGDGPWHRYLFELTLVSPLIMIAVVMMLPRLSLETRPQLFIALFFVVTYAAMASVRYGMSLRFANLWDFPLRFLAASFLVAVTANLKWRPPVVLALITAVMGLYDLRQYHIIFGRQKMPDPITPALLESVDMLKIPRGKN